MNTNEPTRIAPETEDPIQRRLRFRIRGMMLAIVGFAILFGILPDPFLRPLVMLAGGGLLGGVVLVALGALLGYSGFLMFRPTVETPPPPSTWPEFSPPVPRVPKGDSVARWLKVARPLLILFLLLLLLPPDTGIPRLVVGGLLGAFGVVAVLYLPTFLVLMVGRGMKSAGRSVFGMPNESES